ncbi:dihydroorotase [Tichowtungia aerotolerans]|uniref:Dihydroorotase n=1 Tax=Tichowtungia aerotolerans TaxID=2697043 RepID=A0A6P1M5V0_9BACT|nr:dihydroorotase [Tichowtungia aerotolerans]QHI67984.1 dihydroorotase [Tichowtungia aerotolerans]
MNTQQSILIRNADIVNEGSITNGDVLIRHGRIDRIDRTVSAEADIEIDAHGKALLPGMIDCHVHFREPGLTHKADMASESAAAVAGGVTSVMEMPNTSPPAVTNERLEDKFSIAAEKMITNYSFYLGASLNNLDEVKAVDSRNVCGVKVYMGSTTGDMLVDRFQTLEDLFRECPINLTTHCEDTRIISANEKKCREQYGDDVPFPAHPLIRSREACFQSSQVAIELARKYETKLHLLHISTADELNLFDSSIVRVGTARENECFIEEQGKNITGEACVHHLFFDDSAYDRKGALIKCNPAIKTAADREALLKALVTDRLDTIGTDHAPHTLEEKQRPYWTAPSGIPVIQSALPSVLEHFYNGILSLELIAEKTAHNPARIFNLEDRGFIREGGWADLTLIDLNRPHTVTKDNILYKCGWSPFEGTTFHSSVDTTIVSGQIAWQKNAPRATCRGHRLVFNR